MEPVLILIVLAGIAFYIYRQITGSKTPDLPTANFAESRGTSSSTSSLTWPSRDEYACEVVGESHYQDNIARVVQVSATRNSDEPLLALLTPESNNKHDHNAVSVSIGGVPVGHLSRQAAPAYRARLLAEGMGIVPVYCQATITGGFPLGDGSTASYGVMLDIEEFE